MRRALAAMAVGTALAASGCGTMWNLTDLDRQGREQFGGVTRDLRFAGEHPWLPLGPLHEPSCGDARAFLAALALLGIVEVTYVAGLGTETALSLVADTCTAPLVPWINRVELFPGRPVPRPALSGEPVAYPATGPICQQPPPAGQEQDGDLPPLGFPSEQYLSVSTPEWQQADQGKVRRVALPDAGLGLPSLPEEAEDEEPAGADLPTYRWPWKQPDEAGEGFSVPPSRPGGSMLW